MRRSKRNRPLRGIPSSQGALALRTRGRRSRRSQRGIALVAVLIALAIILVITNEFGTETNNDMFAAANYRDQMRTQFLARSAQGFGELVVRIQQRLDNTKIGSSTLGQQFQITDYADMLVQPFCGSPQEVHDALGPFADRMKGIGADIGTCGFEGGFQTEDNKINVNCASMVGPPTNPSQSAIKSEIDALLYFPAYDPVFDENDAEGWHRDRQMQAASILDYIDTDTSHLHDRGTAEDYGYESLKDRYYAKNNKIDTIDEIKLARGVDDRFWTLFGHAFTVYGDCKINIMTLSDPQLIAAILFLTAKNQNDPVVMDPKLLFALAGLVAQARQYGETFSNLNEFIAFVKDPGASVATLASTGQGTLAGSAASVAMSQGIPALQGGQKLGLELDPQKLGQIATIGPRRTYRIQAYGEIAGAAKNKDGSPLFPPIRTTITGVWDTKVVPQNVRKPPVPNGAWVYMKEQ
jgi:hypothetical protein